MYLSACLTNLLEKLNEPVMDLALIGGLITHENIYSDVFRAKIKENPGKINIKEPDYSPAIGAVFMAKKII